MTPDDLFGQPISEPPALPAKAEAKPAPKKAAAPRREMTEDEKIAVQCLKNHVTYTPGSWDKRFVGNLLASTITDKEAPQVWRLFHRYRRQIRHICKAYLLTVAAKLAAPDLRKQAAQEAERQRIQATKTL